MSGGDAGDAVPAEVAWELARLRAENARLLRLLKLTGREAEPPGPAQAGFFEAPGQALVRLNTVERPVGHADATPMTTQSAGLPEPVTNGAPAAGQHQPVCQDVGYRVLVITGSHPRQTSSGASHRPTLISRTTALS